MAPELPVGSDKRRIKAQMFQFRHVNRIQSELQHPLKDFVILMQGIDYPQLDITAIASHPVVVLVLAVLAAEFSVCPAILDLIPTFKTDCKLAVIFSFISHITASLVTSNVANGKENAKTMWRNTGNRPEIFLFLSDSQFFRTGQKKFMVHAGKRKKQKKGQLFQKRKIPDIRNRKSQRCRTDTCRTLQIFSLTLPLPDESARNQGGHNRIKCITLWNN